jgi:hypothetical protein
VADARARACVCTGGQKVSEPISKVYIQIELTSFCVTLYISMYVWMCFCMCVYTVYIYTHTHTHTHTDTHVQSKPVITTSVYVTPRLQRQIFCGTKYSRSLL